MELTSFEYIRKGKQFLLDKRFDLAIVCFESSLSKEINDNELLMEVQDELGNAYISINDYERALDIHMKNMNLAKSVSNHKMETVSYASITIALTSLGRFKEATDYCHAHLENSKKYQNGLEKANALFNMGNIYFYNAKMQGAIIPYDLGHVPAGILKDLESATKYFKDALLANKIVKDKNLDMKILGNYSNVQYILRNFTKSVKLNTRKLNLAVELKDKESEKRTYVNRGNSYVFLNNYMCAIKDFESALCIAKNLGNVRSEMDLLYSLSNTYYLSQNFELAIKNMIDYRNIVIARNNKQCESRANLCLCIIYSELGDYDMSAVYAKNHLEISLELKDDDQCVIAEENLKAIEKMKIYLEHKKYNLFSPNIILSNRKKFQSSIKLPEFVEFSNLTDTPTLKTNNEIADNKNTIESAEEFFKKVHHFQLEKLKDKNHSTNLTELKSQFINNFSSSKKIFLNSLANLQGDRMDDQRTVLSAYK